MTKFAGVLILGVLCIALGLSISTRAIKQIRSRAEPWYERLFIEFVELFTPTSHKKDSIIAGFLLLILGVSLIVADIIFFK